jgi:hypothetical protein
MTSTSGPPARPDDPGGLVEQWPTNRPRASQPTSASWLFGPNCCVAGPTSPTTSFPARRPRLAATMGGYRHRRSIHRAYVVVRLGAHPSAARRGRGVRNGLLRPSARRPRVTPTPPPLRSGTNADGTVPIVAGWVTNDNVVPLLERISSYVGYRYDDLDEAVSTTDDRRQRWVSSRDHGEVFSPVGYWCLPVVQACPSGPLVRDGCTPLADCSVAGGLPSAGPG